MEIKKHIPNFLTSCNLFLGCLSIYYATHNELVIASYLVIFASIFDFADGFAARMLEAYSIMGKELDSLADLVTFGVAPSLILSQMFFYHHPHNHFFLFAPFILTVFSAVRLAKFNVDTRQTDSFIGLPTPANALFWISFALMYDLSDTVQYAFKIAWPILILIALFSILMIIEMPLFALKIKNLQWKGNEYKYILTITSLILVIFFKVFALPVIIILYIFLSLINIFLKNA